MQTRVHRAGSVQGITSSKRDVSVVIDLGHVQSSVYTLRVHKFSKQYAHLNNHSEDFFHPNLRSTDDSIV